jgi:RsiW-degrading membrane proteinase PrsW (M82 family)
MTAASLPPDRLPPDRLPPDRLQPGLPPASRPARGAHAAPAGTGRDVLAVRVTAVILCLLGAVALAWVFYPYLTVFPAATAQAVALQLPVLVLGAWLFRWARPIRPPSRSWSAAAVAWGATAATGGALLANQGLTGLLAKSAGVAWASRWSAAVAAPLNEELLKAAGVVLIALAAPRLIRGPMDGMIYGALTGLGFQVVENVTYSLNFIALSGGTSPRAAVTISAFIRVGVTGLSSHWGMTAVAGAGVGYLASRGLRRGALPAAACLALALFMHFQFDGPRPPVLVKIAVNVVITLAVYLYLRRGHQARARAALAARVAAGTVPASEAPLLLSRGRRRYRLRRARPGADRAEVRARQQADLDGIEAQAADRV